MFVINSIGTVFNSFYYLVSHFTGVKAVMRDTTFSSSAFGKRESVEVCLYATVDCGCWFFVADHFIVCVVMSSTLSWSLASGLKRCVVLKMLDRIEYCLMLSPVRDWTSHFYSNPLLCILRFDSFTPLSFTFLKRRPQSTVV